MAICCSEHTHILKVFSENFPIDATPMLDAWLCARYKFSYYYYYYYYYYYVTCQTVDIKHCNKGLLDGDTFRHVDTEQMYNRWTIRWKNRSNRQTDIELMSCKNKITLTCPRLHPIESIVTFSSAVDQVDSPINFICRSVDCHPLKSSWSLKWSTYSSCCSMPVDNIASFYLFTCW